MEPFCRLCSGLVESLLCLPGLFILVDANRGWDFCRTHFNAQGLLTDLVILACYAIFFALALAASFILGSIFFSQKRRITPLLRLPRGSGWLQE